MCFCLLVSDLMRKSIPYYAAGLSGTANPCECKLLAILLDLRQLCQIRRALSLPIVIEYHKRDAKRSLTFSPPFTFMHLPLNRYQVTVTRTTNGAESNGYVWSVTFDTPTLVGGLTNAGDQPLFYANARMLGNSSSGILHRIEVRNRGIIVLPST